MDLSLHYRQYTWFLSGGRRGMYCWYTEGHCWRGYDTDWVCLWWDYWDVLWPQYMLLLWLGLSTALSITVICLSWLEDLLLKNIWYQTYDLVHIVSLRQASQLYYDANTGIYYYYDAESGRYQFHSKIEVPAAQTVADPCQDNNIAERRGRKFKKVVKKASHQDDMVCNV